MLREHSFIHPLTPPARERDRSTRGRRRRCDRTAPIGVLPHPRNRHRPAGGCDRPTAALLVDLLILLVAAKLGHEVMKRIGQPGIVGEVAAGVVVGPSILGWVEPSATIEVFAGLGVVFLLFWVGLETRLAELRQVGPSALRVGGWGFLFPLGHSPSRSRRSGALTLPALCLKALIDRPRPAEVLPQVDTLVGGTVGSSFPSGHAATSAAGAICLSLSCRSDGASLIWSTQTRPLRSA